MMKSSVLIVDDEPYILPTLAALLGRDFEVLTAGSADVAQALLEKRPVDIILSDQRMPKRTGIQLLEWVREHRPQTVRLLMTGFAELEDAVDAINLGHVYHYLLKPCRTEELLHVLRNAAEKIRLEREREQLIEELRRAKQELEERVRERTRELEQTNHLLQQHAHKLEMLALTDPLTGLLNRRAIDDVARKEIQRHARYPSTLALGLLDVDHFKNINTQYLIPGGDEVLIGLAKVLANSVRTVDAVSRIGGEEFLVVAPETTLEGAEVLAERIRATVANTAIYYNDEPIHVTVSAGFAVAEVGVATDYDQMKFVAATALNEAKSSGRNRCVVRTIPRPLERAC
ncbi:MAG: diguanylate cyclase [Planctomycetes bacterium]|nr:diguanylate cyclase [Planctomycetota bacterium]